MECLKTITIVFLSIILTSGCATAGNRKNGNLVSKKSRKKSRSIKDVYHESMGASDLSKDFMKENIQIKSGVGFVRPFMPVIKPPKVYKVWIPKHEYSGDEDVLYMGNWIFVKVGNFEWFSEYKEADIQRKKVLVPVTSQQSNEVN